MERSGIDPKTFLEGLREEHRSLRWEPLAPSPPRSSSGAEQSRSGTSLEYLHQHWTLPDSFDPEDAGEGLKARALVAFGRVTFRVLGRYLREEREVLAHVVRVSEALERRCDALTLRVQELNEEMRMRQVAESENQARLAVWLHTALPGEDGSANGVPTSRPPNSLNPSPVAATRADANENQPGTR